MEPGTNVLFTFGDSSGNPSRSAKGIADTTHYITVTITMPAKEAHRIDALMQHLKVTHFNQGQPEYTEFHAHQLAKRPGRSAQNNKDTDVNFKNIFDAIVNIVRDMDAIIDVVVMDKRSSDKRHKSSSIITKNWNHASDALYRTISRCSSQTTCVILLQHDNLTNGIVSKIVTRALLPLASASSAGGTVIPRPFFVNSGFCNPIQLADVIAYIVGRVNAGKDARFSALFADWYDQLKPKISHMIYISAE